MWSVVWGLSGSGQWSRRAGRGFGKGNVLIHVYLLLFSFNVHTFDLLPSDIFLELGFSVLVFLAMMSGTYGEQADSSAPNL